MSDEIVVEIVGSQVVEVLLAEGPRGPQGVQGSTGLTGADSVVAGPIGSQGVAGSDGSDGSQGVQGLQGDTGLAGADSTVEGPQGVQGEVGPPVDTTMLEVEQSQVTGLVDGLAGKAGLSGNTFTGTQTVTGAIRADGDTTAADGQMLLGTSLPSRHTAISGFKGVWFAGSNSWIGGESGNNYQGVNLFSNIVRDGSAAWVHQDTSKAGWLAGLNYGSQADEFGVFRSSATSGGANLLRQFTVRPSGIIAGNSNVALGQITSYAGSASTVGAVIRGAAGQTANLQEWQNSSGTTTAAVSYNGNMIAQNLALSWGLSSRAAASSVVPIVSRGAAGQTANLQEWQNSAGSVLASVTSSGQFLGTIRTNFILGNDGLTAIQLTGSRNVGLANATSFGGGIGVVGISNTGGVPTTNPTGGGVLYAEGGALKWRGISNAAQQIIGGDGTVTFTAPIASTVGAVIRGAAGQTANLQEWQNSAGDILSKIDSYGVGNFYSGLYATGGGGQGASIVAIAGSTTLAAIIAKGAAGQTANLQEWQNSAGTVVAAVTPTGQLRGNSLLGSDGLTAVTLYGGRNAGLSSMSNFGGGVAVVGIGNATTVPTSNPTGGGIMYSEGGALKWRGSNGTITTIAAA
jgi:hypothetical protein